MSSDLPWWTGAILLASVGALGAASLIAGMTALAVVWATHSAKRFGNVVKNLNLMRQWDDAGRPEWRQIDGVFRMVPTTGEWSDEEPSDDR